MYSSLNKGKCDVLIAYKQEFESSLKWEDRNPTCTLEWEGRLVKPLKDGFATKLDPGVMCTDLVNEMFSYYMKEMVDNGALDKLWEQHNQHYATEGHCEAEAEGGIAEKGRRVLKGGGNGVDADAASIATESGDDQALMLKDMAGTILFQLVGSLIAVVVAIASRFEGKTKTKRKERRSVTSSNDSRDSNGAEATVQSELRDLVEQLDRLKDMVHTIQEKVEKNEFQPRKRRAKSITTGVLRMNGDGSTYATSLRGHE